MIVAQSIDDVDDDGDVDIVGAGDLFGFAYWYENIDGPGYEWSSHLLDDLFDGDVLSANQSVLMDLDGDGDSDLIQAADLNNNYGGIVWNENLGSGDFAPRAIVVDPEELNAPLGIATGDLDADGNVDLAVAYRDSTFSWFSNVDGRGTLVEHKLLTGSYEGTVSSEVRLIDVDNDADLDVVGLGFVSAERAVFWVENLSGGTFGNVRVIAGSDSILHLAQGDTDIDGDGDADVAWSVGDETYYQLNMGHGDFTIPQFIGIAHFGIPSLGDIDHDNDLDLFAGAWNSTKVWLENMVIGDSNDDGQFDSSDLVTVFQVGKYEHAEVHASFEEGDWNGDFYEWHLMHS